jgi:hypothetical protein
MHPNAAKGKRWELAVFKYLFDRFGRAVRRPSQEGFIDVGDLHLSPFALQLKDEARHTFSSYVDDAEKQAKAAGEKYGAAVVKRRGVATGRAYVVMSLDTFAAREAEITATIRDLREDVDYWSRQASSRPE